MVEHTIPAPSLAGNLLGDPARQPVYVYLPPGYREDQGGRYPVLYLLHGVLDDPTVWIEPAYQGMTIQSTMDSLIAAGEIRPFLVVMPNGKNAYGGSVWVNSPVTGGWEDFVVRDVVSYIDSAYRTVARPESRAIAGHSMGGYGAIRLGMLHPDVFSVVYGMDPCCLCCLDLDLTADLQAWKVLSEAHSIEGLWKHLEEQGDPWPLIAAAGAAAFSPWPDGPPWYFRLPYEFRGDEVVATGTLADWNSAGVVALAPAYEDNLKQLRGLAFATGYRDQFEHIPVGAARFSETLIALDVPHVFEAYEGDHRNRMRERMTHVILPWIDIRLVRGAAPRP